MTTIGTFSKSQDGGFHGSIRTLALSLKAVDIRPVERRGDSGPDYRVYAGPTDLGAAWTVAKPDKPECLSVRLDDPSFPARSTPSWRRPATVMNCGGHGVPAPNDDWLPRAPEAAS